MVTLSVVLASGMPLVEKKSFELGDDVGELIQMVAGKVREEMGRLGSVRQLITPSGDMCTAGTTFEEMGLHDGDTLTAVARQIVGALAWVKPDGRVDGRIGRIGRHDPEDQLLEYKLFPLSIKELFDHMRSSGSAVQGWQSISHPDWFSHARLELL